MKKLIFFISSLLLSLSMSATALAEIDLSSYSIDDLRYLAKQINTRIAELEKKRACFISNSNLSLGDGEAGVMAEDVKRLQDFLREKGQFQYKSTGYFGKLTRISLLAYQASNNLPQTGEFDQVTRERAHSSQCKTSAINSQKTETLKQEELKKLEEKKTETYKKEAYYPESKTQSIVLSSAIGGVTWVTTGQAPYGYKIAWSKNPNPTYPPRDRDRAEYFDNASANKASLSGFDGVGVYYVRVCEYLQGKCGVYSNEVTVELR